MSSAPATHLFELSENEYLPLLVVELVEDSLEEQGLFRVDDGLVGRRYTRGQGLRVEGWTCGGRLVRALSLDGSPVMTDDVEDDAREPCPNR